MPNETHVALFLRAPELGKVKTRLARDLGPEQALDLYRRMAEATVRTVRASGLSVTVWFTPADGREALAGWLGDDLGYRPQPEGDLGHRMAEAVAATPKGDRVILIGGDCPGLSSGHLVEAARALDAVAVVIGPSTDGGYYLLGLHPHGPDLFGSMPWSTDRVLPETRGRLMAAGIPWKELEPLRDVDTAADARVAGLLQHTAVQ